MAVQDGLTGKKQARVMTVDGKDSMKTKRLSKTRRQEVEIEGKVIVKLIERFLYVLFFFYQSFSDFF